MAEIKLTKNELRAQQNRLGQLEKYLPTLQLKKAMLQLEVHDARLEIAKCEEAYQRTFDHLERNSALLAEHSILDPKKLIRVKKIHRHYENIAGVEIPHFQGIDFEIADYNLFTTPPWVDRMIEGLKAAAEAQARVLVAREKKEALEKELREVSIRVNLFEKILIPRAKGNIKKIKIFLGDQQLAAVSQAKVAKAKIEEHKKAAAMGRQHAL